MKCSELCEKTPVLYDVLKISSNEDVSNLKWLSALYVDYKYTHE